MMFQFQIIQDLVTDGNDPVGSIVYYHSIVIHQNLVNGNRVGDEK
jgi:hypothetical protein